MTIALFASTGLTGSRWWREERDGSAVALALYERHYSARRYADGRRRRLFVGRGEKVVLVGHHEDALFVWRRFIDRSGQAGINCAVFRNESPWLASTLILDAEIFAWSRWPDEQRLYTYVDPHVVRSTHPGYCFTMAGWTPAGWTEGGHGRSPLLVLQKYRPATSGQRGWQDGPVGPR